MTSAPTTEVSAPNFCSHQARESRRVERPYLPGCILSMQADYPTGQPARRAVWELGTRSVDPRRKETSRSSRRYPRATPTNERQEIALEGRCTRSLLSR